MKKNCNYSWVTLQKTGPLCLQDVLVLAKEPFHCSMAVLLAVTSRIVTGYFESKCTKPSPYLLRGYSYFPKKRATVTRKRVTSNEQQVTGYEQG
jgi:hypothetical protein